MLNHVPKILSPELLKVLCEMGHSDVIVLGDGNFPADRFAHEGNCKLVRCDGHGVPELLDAILTMIPLDTYVDHPVHLMETSACDRELEIPIWDVYKKIVVAHDPRGEAAFGTYERFAFYENAKKSYCIVQTGEEAIYANIALQKGVIQ